MKWILIALISLVTLPVFANEQTSSSMFQFFIDIAARVDDFFKYTPNFIERIYAYYIKYAIKLKLVMQLETMKFAYTVAQELLTDLSVYQFIDAAFSSLDPDIRGAIGAYGVGAGIMRIIEAMTTRFVLDFMGA
ncbi:DUF2523 family protein [Photobacterium rosenbergii]|uniref:DUF2523 family protein n=1 Tax=Photobacterium rosenbergii TaxID=294936 RepID=A0ABU3ZFE0_9GAMM|nr:DUF2523 family protein [Photobacterium rosenbergii]MDV5168811.1 DUF2523 family protein [Photobacterium rosenbergii]